MGNTQVSIRSRTETPQRTRGERGREKGEKTESMASSVHSVHGSQTALTHIISFGAAITRCWKIILGSVASSVISNSGSGVRPPQFKSRNQPLAGCVTLGQSHNLSVTQFPHLKNEEILTPVLRNSCDASDDACSTLHRVPRSFL